MNGAEGYGLTQTHAHYEGGAYDSCSFHDGRRGLGSLQQELQAAFIGEKASDEQGIAGRNRKLNF
jgi:hypothetical protein